MGQVKVMVHVNAFRPLPHEEKNTKNYLSDHKEIIDPSYSIPAISAYE
jgi:hypothetical protein